MLPLVLGSCAKNFNQSALAKAGVSMSQTTGDVALQEIINNSSLYYIFGQAYTEDIITPAGSMSLHNYLATNYDVNAAAIWGDASQMKTFYVFFAILKSDKKTASLHFGANSTFVSFKQTLSAEFTEGSVVNFQGSDSVGQVTLKGTSTAGKLRVAIVSSTSTRPFTSALSLDSL